MDFAIIKTGGKQYKITEGDIIRVEKIQTDKKTLDFTDLLNNKKVTAELLEEIKGDKIRILKQHPKKHYKKVNGHRQNYSKIKIIKIA